VRALDDDIASRALEPPDDGLVAVTDDASVADQIIE
jgi:hypothetical protein